MPFRKAQQVIFFTNSGVLLNEQVKFGGDPTMRIAL